MADENPKQMADQVMRSVLRDLNTRFTGSPTAIPASLSPCPASLV
jgi:hypothetical protein